MTDSQTRSGAELLATLVKWNEAYRNGQPLVTDAVYDAAEDALHARIAEHVDADGYDGNLLPWMTEFLNYTKSVGAAVPANTPWVKFKHTMPMGSLNKAQDMAQFESWLADCGSQVGRQTLFWSDKLDGISIGMYYEDGQLVRAITRGDGETGEDITRNVLKMKGVVPHIQGFWGFIRGEIVMLHTDWKAHFPEMTNPRNGAAGVAKREDGVGSEHLSVLQYTVIVDTFRDKSGAVLPTKEAEFDFLVEEGAFVPEHGTKTSLKGVATLYDEYISTKRDQRNYDLDGLVWEFNEYTHRDALGTRNHRPHGAVALKFPHDEKPTFLRDILWSVGNSGRVTPVAQFDEVELAGAKVKQASLHNLDKLLELTGGRWETSDGLAPGAQIRVSRRNDVIPYCEEVLSFGDPTQGVFLAPRRCPECGEKLHRPASLLNCTNVLGCPAHRRGAIKVWLNKTGVKHWGDSVVDALFQAGHVKDVSELYTVSESTIADTDMDGRKIGGNAKYMLEDLHAKKDLPLHVFVGSLNIPLCSRSTIRTLVENGFDTLDKLLQATETELAAIPKIGTTRAASLVSGLQARGHLIGDILANGVTIQPPATGIFKGMSFCLTGFRDADLVQAIEGQGGSVKSSVGKTLTALIAKDPKSTTGKAAQAIKHGVPVKSPDDVWAQLGGRP